MKKKKKSGERDKLDQRRLQLEENIETQLSSTKSSNVDAQRVLNVIDIAKRKVQILMYIDAPFIKNFWPAIKEEEEDTFNILDQQSLKKLSPKVLTLLQNQGTFER